MKLIIVFLALLILTVLSIGCTRSNQELATECALPMEYAIRSVCSYAAAEIEGECKVVCYNFPHTENPKPTDDYLKQCASDAECDCSFYAPEDMRGCGCVNGLCAAIVT